MGPLEKRYGIADSQQVPPGQDRFGRFAACTASFLGSRWGFFCAGAVVLAWAVTGPLLHFSDFWQLVANTVTNIVTFLMVFLIQNTQNRDARAINLKLDELIRAVDNARNHMINIERLSDAELNSLEEQFARLRPKHPTVCDSESYEGQGIAAD